MDWKHLIKDIYEALLHVVWGFTPIVIFWGASKVRRFGPIVLLGGFCAALAFALPRELVDQWPIDRWWDTLIDLLMFGFGGFLAGLVAWRVHK
jgi:hypothetical protein